MRKSAKQFSLNFLIDCYFVDGFAHEEVVALSDFHFLLDEPMFIIKEAMCKFAVFFYNMRNCLHLVKSEQSSLLQNLL